MLKLPFLELGITNSLFFAQNIKTYQGSDRQAYEQSLAKIG